MSFFHIIVLLILPIGQRGRWREMAASPLSRKDPQTCFWLSLHTHLDTNQLDTNQGFCALLQVVWIIAQIGIYAGYVIKWYVSLDQETRLTVLLA